MDSILLGLLLCTSKDCDPLLSHLHLPPLNFLRFHKDIDAYDIIDAIDIHSGKEDNDLIKELREMVSFRIDGSHVTISDRDTNDAHSDKTINNSDIRVKLADLIKSKIVCIEPFKIDKQYYGKGGEPLKLDEKYFGKGGKTSNKKKKPISIYNLDTTDPEQILEILYHKGRAVYNRFETPVIEIVFPKEFADKVVEVCNEFQINPGVFVRVQEPELPELSSFDAVEFYLSRENRLVSSGYEIDVIIRKLYDMGVPIIVTVSRYVLDIPEIPRKPE